MIRPPQTQRGLIVLVVVGVAASGIVFNVNDLRLVAITMRALD